MNAVPFFSRLLVRILGRLSGNPIAETPERIFHNRPQVSAPEDDVSKSSHPLQAPNKGRTEKTQRPTSKATIARQFSRTGHSEVLRREYYKDKTPFDRNFRTKLKGPIPEARTPRRSCSAPTGNSARRQTPLPRHRTSGKYTDIRPMNRTGLPDCPCRCPFPKRIDCITTGRSRSIVCRPDGRKRHKTHHPRGGSPPPPTSIPLFLGRLPYSRFGR